MTNKERNEVLEEAARHLLFCTIEGKIPPIESIRCLAKGIRSLKRPEESSITLEWERNKA